MLKFKRLLNLMGHHLHTLPLLILYITDGCNSRCATCDIWKNPRRNMPWALVEELASHVKDLQIRWVLLSGGEAMQHPHWPRIAQQFREAGARVLLLTNGLLLRKQARDVIASVDEVIVSLDGGTAETYAAIRGVDGFDLILDGIRLLRAADIPVTTRTTVQRANYLELPLIIERGLEADVNQISFLPVDVASSIAFGNRFEAEAADLIAYMGPNEHQPPAEALTADEIAELARIIDELAIRYADAFASGKIAESPDKLRRILIQYFQSLIHIADFPPPRCNAPHFSTVVEVDGTLRPCYFLPSYGRLSPKGESLPRAINADSAKQLRRDYQNGRRSECARCVCPLYKNIRSLLDM